MRSPVVDWRKVTKMIMSCRGIEFEALMGKLVELRRSNEMKEFHFIVGSLLRVRKNSIFSERDRESVAVRVKSHTSRRRLGPSSRRNTVSCLLQTALGRTFEVGYIEPTTCAKR